MTRQSVNELVNQRKLLGLRYGSQWKFPEVQFQNRAPLPVLTGVLGVIGDIDRWDALTVLLAPDQPPEQCPVALLQAGKEGGALMAAANLAH